MATQLNPVDASQLALDVYAVNGDIRDLREFLKNPLFSPVRNDKKVLYGEVGGRVIRAAKDAFGLCVRGSGVYESDIFLIFRGTTEANNKADFVTDARIGLTRSNTGLPVHIGFNQTFNSMLSEMINFISAPRIVGTIHCIGHSLGGAVASLAADWLARNTSYSLKLYTFGAPRVGTEWFAKKTTTAIGPENMHRVYHRTDPVPMVALYPFMQAPYGYPSHFIYSNQPLITGEAHLMTNYAKSVTGRSWLELNAVPDQPYDIASALECWLQSRSPVDTSSATFWRWVDSALIYVIKKITMAAVINLQGSFMGLHSVADKIAYILVKGLDLADSVSIWVENLMRKLMQALNMRPASNKKELTAQLIRQVLVRLQDQAARDARNAVQKNKRG